MKHDLLKMPIKGIIPPIITPLLDNETLDLKGLNSLVERLVTAKVSGLFVLGTTGEAQSLSFELRKKMLKTTCEFNNGRLPILVCISDTSIDDSILLANYAFNCGADALVATIPYYYAAGQPELIDYYDKLIERLPLPLFLYNMPSYTKVNFSPNTVRRIAQNEKVIGFKDSSANTVYFQSVMHAMDGRKNFSMYVGPEEITAEIVMMGGDGGINGGANMFPELYVALYNAAKAVDIKRTRELQNVIMEISKTIYCIGKHNSSYLKGLKCALYLMGICSGYLALPISQFEEAEVNQVREALERLKTNNLLTDLCDFSIVR